MPKTRIRKIRKKKHQSKRNRPIKPFHLSNAVLERVGVYIVKKSKRMIRGGGDFGFRDIIWDKLIKMENEEDTIKNIKNITKECIMGLCENTSPLAIPILKENLDKVGWFSLSKNPHAIDLLKEIIKENIDKVNWHNLSMNPNPDVIPLLKKNLNKVKWDILSMNPGVIPLLKENLDKVNWVSLTFNPNPDSIPLLKKYSEKNPIFKDYYWIRLSKSRNPEDITLLTKKINDEKKHNMVDIQRIDEVWEKLSENPEAIPFLKKNVDKINWGILSRNPSAIDLLENNKTKVSWYNLSINTNPEAIDLLEENIKKIDWGNLSRNPNAIDLLEKNINKVNYNELLRYNDNAFSLPLDNANWENKNTWISLFKNINVCSILEKYVNEFDECIQKIKNGTNDFDEDMLRILFANPRIFEEEQVFVK